MDLQKKAQKIKILIIGGGPSGLSALKALQNLPFRENYQIKCIEKQENWGGQWHYTWRTGTDRYGQPVHSSMYSQLWTNAPKQCFQFPDYTFKDHFKIPVPSYLPRNIYMSYFLTRFERLGLKKIVNFNTIARNVRFLEDKKLFEVRYTNLKTKVDYIQHFNYVIVATGHFSYPHIPEFQGIESFKGKILHSHDIRTFEEFKNQRILIVGGGRSGQDLVAQCYKYNALHIVWVYRSLKWKYNYDNFPKNVDFLHGLIRIDQKSAYFENGERKEIDSIIFCTGYLHHFPFLQENLTLSCNNILWPPNLYKSVAWYNNPQLFYIGMGGYMLGQNVSDIQGYLVRDIISGKHKLPDLSQKQTQDSDRQKQMQGEMDSYKSLVTTVKYCRQIINETEYPNYNFEGVIDLYMRSIREKEDDIINFRDYGNYKSVVTGQESCIGQKKWMDVKIAEQFDADYKQQMNTFFKFQHETSN